MSNSLTPLLLALVLVVAVVLAILVAKFERQRRESFNALAVRRNWQFRTSGDEAWLDRFTHNPFNTGHNRSVGSELVGEDRGRRIAAFDYTYFTTETSSNGKGGTTTREQSHQYHVAVVETGLRGAVLSLSGENWLLRVVDAITNGDIDFESEAFNRRFRVHCSNRKFAYDVITQQAMDALLAVQPERLVWENGWLMCADNGRWDPLQIEGVIAGLHTIVDTIPQYLLHPGTPPGPATI